MKKFGFRLMSLFLAVLLLAGCGNVQQMLDYISDDYTAYADMEYIRPNLSEMQRILDDALLAAQGDSTPRLLDCIYAFNDFYDDFYTNYSLADIRYSGDLTDIYWEDEYNFCVQNSAAVDAALEELYYALAKSPCREELETDDYFGEGFFDSYEGENSWDTQFTALLEQEAELQSRYYDLSMTALDYEFGTEAYYDACGEEMAQLLVELIGLRQQIAAYWGYDDYVQFANDFYYYRDYTPEESSLYLAQIQQELVPLYTEVSNSSNWDSGNTYCTEEETYAYVRDMAQAMGGTVLEAFELMDWAGLYDISYGENKYNSSYEVYLTSYWEPFIFMNPSLTAYDKLVFAHEFGHFCNDYASYGSYAGTDVAEVFSQGMEYLSLCYGEDGSGLTWVKLADSLCLFVEQAAFASFEQRMYGLTGEDLTVENLRALYAEVAAGYGFESFGFTDWEFVTITHYYTNPMYIISYVVSNDAALQLYQLELEEAGAGLACFEENLDTQAIYFLEFLESAGLRSPFEAGRLAKVRKTLEEALR